jgi:hypothetical protein
MHLRIICPPNAVWDPQPQTVVTSLRRIYPSDACALRQCSGRPERQSRDAASLNGLLRETAASRFHSGKRAGIRLLKRTMRARKMRVPASSSLVRGSRLIPAPSTESSLNVAATIDTDRLSGNKVAAEECEHGI